jgi:hypothetical protein
MLNISFYNHRYSNAKTIFMLRNSRRSLFAIALTGIILFGVACSKSDNNTNSSAITVANLSGSYKLTAATASALGITINVLDSLPACQRDDIYQLNSNLSFGYVDAGTKCAPPGDYTDTWSLIGTTKLVIGADTANIQSFSGKTLVVTKDVTITGLPGPVTTTDTFTKQ